MSEVGIVLTGGGARAAYQVGVLKAISDMFPGSHHPFRIILGTSAGAINAVALAAGGSIFRHNITRLEQVWSEISIDQVYVSNTYALLRNMTHLARRVLYGGHDAVPQALLDNSPLRRLLEEHIDFGNLRAAIASGDLAAVGVNACGYSTGQNVCFFESDPSIKSWCVGQRAGTHTRLTLDHVLASSAIPTVFSPVKLNREYFGDGVTRQMAHISPALRLGATKVLVIGVSANGVCSPKRPQQPDVPTFGQIIAHVFNGMFLDTLDYDVDRARQVNQLLVQLSDEQRAKAGVSLQPVEILEISPSCPIEELAAEYLEGMPMLLRKMAGGDASASGSGASLISYLLFDKKFCRALIRLGYEDAQAHAKQLAAFFAHEGEDKRSGLGLNEENTDG